AASRLGARGDRGAGAGALRRDGRTDAERRSELWFPGSRSTLLPEVEMKGMHLVVPAAALLLLGGCAEGGSVPGPTAPGLAAAGPRLSPHAGPTAVSGEFAAIIDPSTFTFTPRGQNCRLTVDGALVFSGSIEGAATGTTSALVFAPCDEVAAAPPGAHPDVFQSRLHFVGTVNG